MSQWYHIQEKSAGKYRLIFLWCIYNFLGLTVLKSILYPIVAVITFFSKSVRQYSKEYRTVLYDYCKKHSRKCKKFSSFNHILNYAYALADKMSAVCDKKTPLKFQVNKNKDWVNFQQNILEGKGIFLISSHLGNVETFCAFPYKNDIHYSKKLHAIMEMTQDSIFRQFIEKRTKNAVFNLYPAERMNFQTVMALYESLNMGDIVLMAGDRVSSQNVEKTLTCKLLDKKCEFPLGTFQFAKKMKSPTYSIVLLYQGHNTYQISLKQIDTSKSINDIAEQYVNFVEKNLLKYPAQWYNFYSFFK